MDSMDTGGEIENDCEMQDLTVASIGDYVLTTTSSAWTIQGAASTGNGYTLLWKITDEPARWETVGHVVGYFSLGPLLVFLVSHAVDPHTAHACRVRKCSQFEQARHPIPSAIISGNRTLFVERITVAFKKLSLLKGQGEFAALCNDKKVECTTDSGNRISRSVISEARGLWFIDVVRRLSKQGKKARTSPASTNSRGVVVDTTVMRPPGVVTGTTTRADVVHITRQGKDTVVYTMPRAWSLHQTRHVFGKSLTYEGTDSDYTLLFLRRNLRAGLTWEKHPAPTLRGTFIRQSTD